jgi:protein-disulfide isomerase
MQGPQKRSSATDAALVSVLLINSLAVAYGFYQLRLISDTFQWSVAPALAVTAANRLEASTSPSQPTADIFWSFSCPACRASAPAIDSVKTEFGAEVRWRFHFITLGPRLDPLGYRAALLAACRGEDLANALFMTLRDGREMSQLDLDAAAEANGVGPEELAACDRSREAQRKVWQDAFDAHAQGIVATPTVRVNGIGIQAPIKAEPLREFIASFMRSGT